MNTLTALFNSVTHALMSQSQTETQTQTQIKKSSHVLNQIQIHEAGRPLLDTAEHQRLMSHPRTHRFRLPNDATRSRYAPLIAFLAAHDQSNEKAAHIERIALHSPLPLETLQHAIQIVDQSGDSNDFLLLLDTLNTLEPNHYEVGALTEEYNLLFHSASQKGFIDVIMQMLTIEGRGIDPSSYGHLALMLAAGSGHSHVVDLLLKKQGQSIDPAMDENFALFLASKNGHLDVVKRLLKDERIYESTPLNFINMINNETDKYITKALSAIIREGTLCHTLIHRLPEEILYSGEIQTAMATAHNSSLINIKQLLRSDTFKMLPDDIQANIIQEAYCNHLFLQYRSEDERALSIHTLIESINQ